MSQGSHRIGSLGFSAISAEAAGTGAGPRASWLPAGDEEFSRLGVDGDLAASSLLAARSSILIFLEAGGDWASEGCIMREGEGDRLIRGLTDLRLDAGDTGGNSSPAPPPPLPLLAVEVLGCFLIWPMKCMLI